MTLAIAKNTPYLRNGKTFVRCQPDVDIGVLQRSFDNVPADKYFQGGRRYRTTSRVEITPAGFRLLPKLQLYQPPSVNKISNYGGISRDYDDAPVELIESSAFQELVRMWIELTGTNAKTFSVHQIRTTLDGAPVPEGRHQDGTDWTGLYVVKRHEISPQSARTSYWDSDGEIMMEDVLQEGELITFFDAEYTHNTTPLEPASKAAYRDVFVLTLPEHGENLTGKGRSSKAAG